MAAEYRLPYTAQEFEEKLAKIKDTDQSYNPDSENAQSGIAIAEALEVTAGRKTTEGGEIFNDYENNQANALYSHAEGQGTTASGSSSHAEGRTTIASAFASHAEGVNTTASGKWSHAEGNNTIAQGVVSHAEGDHTVAKGAYSHAEGERTQTNTLYSHAEGQNTIAGAKVFWAGEGSVENNTYTLDSIEGIEIGDYYSYKCVPNEEAGITYNGTFDFCGTITNIDGNTVTVSYFVKGQDDAFQSGYFWLPKKPGVGTIIPEVEQWQHTEGSDTTAIMGASHAEGYGTVASGRWSHAEGKCTVAGYGSHAEGRGTEAMGLDSHSEGFHTLAKGEGAHAEGHHTVAIGDGAHAEGIGKTSNVADTFAGGMRPDESYGALASGAHVEGTETKATKTNAHAEGLRSKAEGHASHAEGADTQASNDRAHAEGQGTQANGYASHAEGEQTVAGSRGAHAEGFNTTALQDSAHSEGHATSSNGMGAHSEGISTIASNKGAHAEGNGTQATGENAHAEGGSTVASGGNSHAEGVRTEAKATGAHSEGADTVAEGQRSHTEGNVTYAKGFASHAEGGGDSTVGASHKQKNFGAFGDFSHSEGVKTKAVGIASHAEGGNTIANGYASHTEGEQTTTEGRGAHAEGFNTEAKQDSAHAEGIGTHAYGIGAHSEGFDSVAEAKGAHAEGISTIAHIEGSHAQGKYNKITKDTLTNVSLDGVIRAEATNYIFKTDDGIEWNLNTASGSNHYCFSYSEFSVGKKHKFRLILNASKAATTNINLYAWEDLSKINSSGNRVDLAINKSISLVEGENVINIIVTIETYPYLAMRFYNNPAIDATVTLTKLEIVDEEIDENIISSIGNGFDEDNRSNALAAYKDGHVEVGKMGDTNNSVVTKGYVDSLVAPWTYEEIDDNSITINPEMNHKTIKLTKIVEDINSYDNVTWRYYSISPVNLPAGFQCKIVIELSHQMTSIYSFPGYFDYIYMPDVVDYLDSNEMRIDRSKAINTYMPGTCVFDIFAIGDAADEYDGSKVLITTHFYQTYII